MKNNLKNNEPFHQLSVAHCVCLSVKYEFVVMIFCGNGQ